MTAILNHTIYQCLLLIFVIYRCHLSLNATDFLEKLRGQKLVFVGDSLNRNMWESMVCILRQSVKDKKHVFEISGKTEFKKKGVYAFRFEASFWYIHEIFLSIYLVMISH